MKAKPENINPKRSPSDPYRQLESPKEARAYYLTHTKEKRAKARARKTEVGTRKSERGSNCNYGRRPAKPGTPNTEKRP